MQRGQDNESWNDDGTGSGRRGMGIQGGPEFNSSDPMSNQPQNPQGFRGDDQMRLGNDDNMNMNAGPGFSSSGGGGGQFGNNADPSMQGGDFSDDPMGGGGGGGGTQRASAGRDDNGTNFGSSAGPAAMSDGSGNNPSTGDKFMGSMQKAAGRVSGNANMVERGEMRKTGGPQADDTLL